MQPATMLHLNLLGNLVYSYGNFISERQGCRSVQMNVKRNSLQQEADAAVKAQSWL